MLALASAANPTLSHPPLFSDLVAETQGVIGYWLQQGLANAGLAKTVVTLVTQTLVDRDDPAFEDPTCAEELLVGVDDLDRHRHLLGIDLDDHALLLHTHLLHLVCGQEPLGRRGGHCYYELGKPLWSHFSSR